MLYIVIKFPNGDTFHVPAEVIAENRTEYYAEKDGFEKPSKDWNEEFDQSMKSYELFDWIQNSMDWDQLKAHAVKQESSIDENYYDRMFTNSEITSVLK